jgi:hypothetical protein
MNDLADGERRLLDDMRQALSPTRADRERLGARISASLAVGTMSPSLGDPASAPNPSGGTGLLGHGIRSAGGQVLAGALVAAAAFGAGYLTAHSRAKDPKTSVATPARVTDVRPSASVTSAESRGPTFERAVPPPVASTRAAAPSNAPSPAPSSATLREEARELQRVDRALRSGTPQLALGLLRELDERIPRGVLLEERAAARLIARCQNGDASAPNAAVAWLERHAQSVYAPRLRAACATKAEPE